MIRSWSSLNSTGIMDVHTVGKGMKDVEFHTTMNLVLLTYSPIIAIGLGNGQN